MIRALGRIRTPDRLYEAGEVIPGLVFSEEERLIAIGVAERIEEEKTEQPPQPKQSAQPRKKRRKK